jgi:hypothetical protein
MPLQVCLGEGGTNGLNIGKWELPCLALVVAYYLSHIMHQTILQTMHMQVLACSTCRSILSMQLQG